jgi:hypothetical protein
VISQKLKCNVVVLAGDGKQIVERKGATLQFLFILGERGTWHLEATTYFGEVTSHNQDSCMSFKQIAPFRNPIPMDETDQLILNLSKGILN